MLENTQHVVLQISGETLQCLKSIAANELRALIHWSSHVFYDRRNNKIESSTLHIKEAARPASLDVHGRRRILLNILLILASQNVGKNSTQLRSNLAEMAPTPVQKTTETIGRSICCVSSPLLIRTCV